LTPDERLFFQQAILDRIVAYPNFFPSADAYYSSTLVAECLERLKCEGNTRLLGAHELSSILRGLQGRLAEIKMAERSTIRKGILQIRKRAHLGRLIYPRSRLLRASYQVRHLIELLKRGVALVARPVISYFQDRAKN